MTTLCPSTAPPEVKRQGIPEAAVESLLGALGSPWHPRVLCTAANHASGQCGPSRVLCRVWWTRTSDDNTPHCSGRPLRASLLLSLGSTSPLSACLGHTKGDTWCLWAWQRQGPQREGGQSPSAALQRYSLGQGSLSPESQALGSPSPPEALQPQVLSPLPAAGAVFVLCYGDHTQHCQFPGRSACARVNVMIVQIQRRLSVCVCAHGLCVRRVCFKPPLGGNSFFSPLPVWL